MSDVFYISSFKHRHIYNNMATFKIKKDTADNYYWILKSDLNQKIIAKSSESYESKRISKRFYSMGQG